MLRFQEEMDRQGKKQKKDKINDRLIGCAVMRKLSSVLMLYLVVKLKLLEKVLSFVQHALPSPSKSPFSKLKLPSLGSSFSEFSIIWQ